MNITRKDMNFPPEKDEKNNVTIALNVLYGKKKKKDPACDSKYNSNYENKFILLKISNREKQ